MSEATPVVVLSSGGKDSLFMLDQLRRDPSWRPEALVTTVAESSDCVAFHGTSAALLREQADSLGLPLTVVGLPDRCDNRTYQDRLARALEPYRARGIDRIACGDLFLADIRRWREQSFEAMGWEAVFPIWRTPTREMARQLVSEPWRIMVTGLDRDALAERLLGLRFDEDFLALLPDGVDPCGENGEFHTFVCNGPGFAHPVDVTFGRQQTLYDRYRVLELQTR